MNKICVCIPHNFKMIEKQFFFSALRMQREFYEWVIKKKRNDLLSFICQNGYNLDQIRNDLVEQALSNKQDYLLFVDTDQSFPKNMIVMMLKTLEEFEEYDAITGVVHQKTPPYIPCIYGHKLDNGRFSLASSWSNDGYIELDACGMGAVMIRSSLFKKMKPPYFRFIKKNKKYPNGLGEDLYFWTKANKKGARLICDPRIKVSHHADNWVNTDTYIEENNLKRTKNGFTISKAQQDKMTEEHKKQHRDSQE